MNDHTEMTELGFEIPKGGGKGKKDVCGRPQASAEAEVELGRMDFAALRKECGSCEDENGVSLWTLLESLRADGAKTVHLF